jgi:hypothetical protein
MGIFSLQGKRSRLTTDIVAGSATLACILLSTTVTNVFDTSALSRASYSAVSLAFRPESVAHDYVPGMDSVFCEHVRLGLKYVPSCFEHAPEHLYPLLITSTGRSGTKYMASVLQELGYSVTHDDAQVIGSDGAVSWPLAVNTLKSYPTWVKHPGNARFNTLIHQVRDPLKSIPSRAAHIIAIMTPYVKAHTPEMQHMTDAFRNNSMAVSLLHYVTWHNLIELQNPDMRFRIEALDTATLKTILRTAKLPLPADADFKIDRAMSTIDNKTNSDHVQEHNDVTWSELFAINAGLAQRAYDMAVRYGYNYTSTHDERLTVHKFDIAS